MSLREAAQQALEALEDIFGKNKVDVGAINVLRAALAEDAMQRLTDVQQEMEATIKDNLTVEPVAYVTGYSKGYATVRPIDQCLLMPVGMALYRSPPKLEPLTEEEISAIDWKAGETLHDFARAIERAHGIGGEE